MRLLVGFEMNGWRQTGMLPSTRSFESRIL
jgi:hypothetical protein